MAEESRGASDLDFLKDVPPPPGEPSKGNRFHLTLQILAVPLLILAVAVGVFVFISYVTHDSLTAAQLLALVNSSTGQVRKQYANEFVRKLVMTRGDVGRPAPKELADLVPGLLAGVQALQRLSPRTEEDDTALRILISALGAIQERGSAPELVRIMNEEQDPYLVAECLSALGSIGDPGSAPAIRAHLKTGTDHVRKYAAFNLAALKDPEQKGVLRGLLHDDSVEVRWNSAFGLAYYHGDDSGAGILRSMLTPQAIPKTAENYEWQRTHAILMAARGLAVIKDRESLAKLKEISEKDGAFEVRDGCRQAIAIIESK